ncbi:MAG: ABC transporter ATP-binding protein [Candidatus Cloacimonadota bacterium]|nr:ABC transporter ATP-binding protein [Candidatus Cloacimonadota bacterium]
MIKIKNLSFQYDRDIVLKNISLEIKKHDFIGIIGPNGAGKSTLLKCLSGFLKSKEGKIFLGDKPVESYEKIELAKQVSVVTQQSYYEFDFYVKDIVLMGRFPYLRFWQNFRKSDEKATKNTLKELELSHLANRRLSELSGGEFQLVMIARALNQDTDILLLDEPAAHLDIHHQIRIFSILKKLNLEQKKTIISVSHNINLAAEFCDKILILADGEIADFGKVKEVINEKQLSKIYQVPVRVVNNPFTEKPNIVYDYEK